MFNNNLVLLAIPVALAIALVGGIPLAGTEITVSATPYELIATPAQLRMALPLLESAPPALDMEMENHCHLYGLHIVLIQLSTLTTGTTSLIRSRGLNRSRSAKFSAIRSAS